MRMKRDFQSTMCFNLRREREGERERLCVERLH